MLTILSKGEERDVSPSRSWLERFKKTPTDLVGIDLSSQEVRAVRVRKGATDVTVTAADIFPYPPGEEEENVQPISLAPNLRAKYAAVTIPGNSATVKYLSFPGQMDAGADAAIVQNLGLKDPSGYRIAYKVITPGGARSESRLLATAMPEDEAARATARFATGLPAPHSLELAELAALTAFLHGPSERVDADCVGTLSFGERATFFSLFRRGALAMMRKLDFGTEAILGKLEETLGVNRETAQDIIADGAFDISQAVGDVMEPLIKQLIVSRDFVERRENCRIKKIYMAGGPISSREALSEMQSTLGAELEPWNPFDGLNVASNAVPTQWTGQEWRFAAALGACLGGLE